MTFKRVCDQISFLDERFPTPDVGENLKEFHIIVIPNLLFSCKNLLETEGLDGIVALHRFSFDFIKIDRNLVSLELPNIYRDVFIKKDLSLLNSIATSLRIFNMVHGRPRMVISYGENAEKIVTMVNRKENMKKSVAKGKHEHPDFNAMLVMDRSKDFPSCLLTPVTYSSLMVELFDVKAGILAIDPNNNKIKTGKLNFLNIESKDNSSDEAEVKTLRMCGTSDELYTYNKYRHFSEVVNLIKSESKNLEEERNKYSRKMNLEQMKEFVQQNLPKVAAQKKVLYKHLIICEKIVQEMSGNFERQQNFEEMIVRNENRKQILAYIDEQLHTNAHRFNILRLMCLYHICVGGLTADEVNKFIGAYLNTFGHKHLSVFLNLMNANLFPDINRVATKNLIGMAQSTMPKKTQFQIEAGKVKLVPNEEPTASDGKQSPKACPSYVFNGNYIPFIAQFASLLLKTENFTEFANKFAHLENLKVTGSCFKDDPENLKDATSHSSTAFPIKPRSLFVYVVGGITYAEIAACNMIESLTGSKIVLASDRITSGIDIMKAAFC